MMPFANGYRPAPGDALRAAQQTPISAEHARLGHGYRPTSQTSAEEVRAREHVRLEAAIERVGRDVVFARVWGYGWPPGSVVPTWVWWRAVDEVAQAQGIDPRDVALAIAGAATCEPEWHPDVDLSLVPEPLTAVVHVFGWLALAVGLLGIVALLGW